MSISSQEITTSATLEQFRVQFNNLVSDVQGLESGTASFSNIEVKEDGNLTFEGATNDGFETTITVTDPTADRTITFPNATGDVVTTGDSNTVTGTMITTDTVAEANMADDSVGSDQLKTLVTLLIKDSGGTTLKTIYGAGA